MTVYILLSGDTIADFSFEGDTAIVTTASAAIFWEGIIGLDIASILTMRYPEVEEILGIPITPKRKFAATLALLATRNAIHTFLHDGIIDDFSDVLE